MLSINNFCLILWSDPVFWHFPLSQWNLWQIKLLCSIDHVMNVEYFESFSLLVESEGLWHMAILIIRSSTSWLHVNVFDATVLLYCIAIACWKVGPINWSIYLYFLFLITFFSTSMGNTICLLLNSTDSMAWDTRAASRAR